ncbi:VOC family protein [Actinomycetospora termitidis]|uniref:VOC family protein n=1 Tax=Actinomycetospora termitidis TaxID=3053470 RepID=A0ABT7M1N3_9PSEU|nr:VOC family protein [Actinomycetospora sp. Odt1-22]MDL5154568.1 VOC family protein [Actinomycetospora sp. Odt1-22]
MRCVYLENLVRDARDPGTLGRFWAAALGLTELTDEPDGYEARLPFDDHFLDLCFQRVDDPSPAPNRLHLDLRGGEAQQEVVDRLLRLGAVRADIGQGDVPWTVLADPEGEAFCVMEDRPAYRHGGPLAGLPLDSADPERDAAFWAAVSGWVRVEGTPGVPSLRHPSGTGPLLELCREPAPKGAGKNRLHLDLRAEPSDPAGRVLALGATLVADPPLPWTIYADPSGNEFCVLDARS